jgi:hypothetical protein
VGLVLGYVTSVVVDLAILIEVFLLDQCHTTHFLLFRFKKVTECLRECQPGLLTVRSV